MTLGKKILVYSLPFGIANILLCILLLFLFIAPRFYELEQEDITHDMERVLAAVNNEISHLDAFCADYSVWDDSHEFFQTRSKKFIADNLTPEVMLRNRLNAVQFIKSSGLVIFSDFRAGEGESLRQNPPLPLPSSLLRVVLPHGRPPGALRGILSTPEGAMLIAARPVTDTAGTALPRGILVMGRLLGQGQIARLKAQTRVDFAIAPLDEAAGIRPGEITIASAEGRIAATSAMADIDGRPIFQVRIENPGRIMRQGNASLLAFMLTFAAGGVLLLGGSFLLLRKVITKPLAHLAASTQEIKESKNLAHRLPVESDDEIGVLAVRFNSLLTELQQAADSLRASEEALRTLYEEAPLGIYTSTPDGRLQSVNKYFATLLDYGSPEEALRAVSSVREQIYANPADRDRLRLRLSGPVRVTDFVTRFKTAKGEARWVSLSARAVYGPGGSLHHYEGFCSDINERVLAEAALRAGEVRLRTFFDASSDLIFLKDSDLRLIMVNRGLADFCRTSPQDCLGRTDALFLPPEHVADSQASDIATLEEGTLTSHVLNVGQRLYELRKFPVAVGDGGVGVGGYMRDITGLRRAEEALRESEKRWRMMVETSLEGIFTMDAGARITYLNHRLAEMLGYQPEELLGQHISVVAFPEDMHAIREKVRNRQEGITERYERRLRRKDGGEVWTILSATPLQGDEGSFLGSMATFVDITELKRAEEALREATRQAQSANRAKSDFLATMSHEIRTPMNAVLGMAHLALGSGLPPRQEQYVRTIDRAARSLLALLNDILDFSKIEAGMLSCEHIPFNLDEVLEDAAILVAPQALAKGLEFFLARGPDVPTGLVGDPLRLRQVLVNFAGNAVKFTEQGEVRVTVRLAGQDEAGRPVVAFEVRDTGIGMAPDQMELLFRPFTQVESSTTRRFGGTGLGLSISKRFVELMGGTVRVQSEVGRGSCFVASLPFERAPERDSALAAEELRDRPLLVAAERNAVREGLLAALEGLGLTGAGAASGQKALEALRRAARPFALVIASDDLADLGPDELAQAVAELGQGAVLIPLLSQGASPGGAAGPVLERPVLRSQLAEVVLRALGQSSETTDRVCGRSAGGGPGLTSERASGRAGTLRGRRVLLVEDIHVNQVVAQGLLQELGLEVTTADNGQEALRRLEQGRFDAVLMDIEMPVMDGYETTQRIRQQPGLEGLPVIAMTAHAFGSERAAILGSGMNDHVSKPIDPSQLFATLYRWIPVRPAAEAASPGAGSAEAAPAPELPGIDTRAGLERFLGDGEVYEAVLRNTLAQFSGHLDAIQAALDSGAPGEARRLAHALRGVAGNIGAGELHRCATALERSLDEVERSLDEGRAAMIAPQARELAEAFGLVMGGLRRRYGSGAG